MEDSKQKITKNNEKHCNLLINMNDAYTDGSRSHYKELISVTYFVVCKLWIFSVCGSSPVILNFLLLLTQRSTHNMPFSMYATDVIFY